MIVQTSEDGLVFRLSDHTPDIIRQILLERGWTEYDEIKSKNDGEWNLWWRTQRFRRSEHTDIAPWQRLNHFPSTDAITRKDCLVRNLRRMRCVHGSSIYDFHPLSYILPNEYTKFVTDYAKESQKNGGKDFYWICKPTDLSRGRGIFVFKDLKDLNYDCPVIVQRYISSPLLISGYKFDLRIYVCVPSFFPLTIYIYQEGIVRFGTDKFDLGQLGNVFSHLTNTSINKYGPAYATDKERVGPGCKWTLSQLRSFLRQMDNVDETLLWQRISNIVTLTMATQAPTVPKSQSCFELFGFDILIDENFKPWLLEVNFSPALSMDCQADFIAKHSMISDLIDLLNFKESDSMRGGKIYHNSSNPSGESRRFEKVSRRRRDSQSPREDGPTLNYMYSKPKLSKYSPLLMERSKFLRRSNTNSSTRSNDNRNKGTPQHTPRQHWHSRLANGLDSKHKKDKISNDKLPRITKNVDSDKEDTKSSDSGVSSSSSIPRNLSSSSMASSQSSIDNMSRNEEEESNNAIGNRNSASSPGLNENSRWIVGSDNVENGRTMLSPQEGYVPSPKLNRYSSNRSSLTKRASSKHCVKTKTLPRIHQRNASPRHMSPGRSTRTAPSGEDILKAKSEANASKLFPIAEVNNVPMSKLSLDSITEKGSEAIHSLSSRIPESTPKGLRKKKNITSAPHTRATDVLRSGEEVKENNGKRSIAGSMSQNRGTKKKLTNTYRSPYSISSTASTKTTSNPWPRTRVGDFVLTFPWNETLRKASGTNFDMKTIIKEQQSVLKKLSATSNGNRKRRESAAITKSEAIELSFMLKFEDKDSNPLYFWGPQNPPLLSSVLS